MLPPYCTPRGGGICIAEVFLPPLRKQSPHCDKVVFPLRCPLPHSLPPPPLLCAGFAVTDRVRKSSHMEKTKKNHFLSSVNTAAAVRHCIALAEQKRNRPGMGL